MRSAVASLRGHRGSRKLLCAEVIASPATLAVADDAIRLTDPDPTAAGPVSVIGSCECLTIIFRV